MLAATWRYTRYLMVMTATNSKLGPLGFEAHLLILQGLCAAANVAAVTKALGEGFVALLTAFSSGPTPIGSITF